VVLAVDGRSSSGKTTLAARLHDVVAGSAVVHTDDIAWWHSRFGWADLLIDGILTPARAGRPVSYRPPRWDERQRPGAIEVPADCPLLIVEGVGAARRETAHLTDAAIWVQADERETERRNLARVGQPGGSQTVRHMRDWMAEEVVLFGSTDRTCSRPATAPAIWRDCCSPVLTAPRLRGSTGRLPWPTPCSSSVQRAPARQLRSDLANIWPGSRPATAVKTRIQPRSKLANVAKEVPFLARHRPWERADLIACGTPQIPFNRATQLVVAPPLVPVSPVDIDGPG
jgi:hypothetical protein